MIRGSEKMGSVAYFRFCLLSCLIFNPGLEATQRRVFSPRPVTFPRPRTRTTICPRDWLHYEDHCYGFFSEEKTWSNAEVACQHHRLRAHLASILTQAESDMVANYIARSGYKGQVWIGLHDSRQDRRWTWTDGSLYRYSAWVPKQPDNWGNIEYCGQLVAKYSFKNWNDEPCDKPNAYVCRYAL